jgi:hypothetical protein
MNKLKRHGALPQSKAKKCQVERLSDGVFALECLATLFGCVEVSMEEVGMGGRVEPVIAADQIELLLP